MIGMRVRWSNVTLLATTLGFAHVVCPPIVGLPTIEQVVYRVGILLIGVIGYTAGWRYWRSATSSQGEDA